MKKKQDTTGEAIVNALMKKSTPAEDEKALNTVLSCLENLEQGKLPFPAPQLEKEEQKYVADILKKMFLDDKKMYEALEIPKDLMESLYASAYEMFKGGKLNEARELFKMLIQFDSEDHRFYQGLGGCYLEAQDYKNAVYPLSAWWNLQEDSPNAPYYLAISFLGLNKVMEAKIALHCASIRAKDPKYTHLEGRISLMQNKVNNILRILENAEKKE